MTSYTYYKITKTYCSMSAEIYKNFITLKSDLQLNLKVVMSK